MEQFNLREISRIPMSQRKKKPTEHQSQKLAAAHYRNEFFRKMKHIIDACCGADITL
ncbi:MAG: hypothetical protein U5K79_24075 [Cyclobacteriaceae bacterium]|nr:hypothetical protein [Cyclobacteriaceae bacterium]